MSPSGRDAEGARNVSEFPPGGKIAVESPAVAVDDGHWEDFTCVTPWEDFVRSLEDVLRGWKAYDTELVTSEDAEDGQPVLSKCLEHDGKLFSVQLVPGARMDPLKTRVTRSASGGQRTETTPPVTREASRSRDSTVSAACDLENRQVDFSVEVGATPLQRWFGLEQYILLRSLCPGEVEGMPLDQLLSAVTIAAGNSKCSVPLLVSCDWDGLDYDPAQEGDEQEGEEEDRHGDVAREGGRLENMWDLRNVGGDATCKGYSAPGSKGVACSVRFETAVAEKPPSSYLFLDGLSTLFVSKLRDARTSPGRIFAPTVTTSVQQSWEWKAPRRDPPVPAPSLSLGASITGRESQTHETFLSRSESGQSQLLGGEQEEVRRRQAAREAVRTAGNSCGDGEPVGRGGDDCSDARKAGVRRLLKAIVGDNSGVVLWGPTEDPLVSVNVRVRWTDLRDGLAEENSLYSTLDPMHGLRGPSFGRGQSIGGCAGQWFVSARWKDDAMTADAGVTGEFSPGEGRLSAACFHLLSALVLTTAMHPGTLMADLGAVSGADSPQVIAEEYGKASAASLSQEARTSIERLCSRNDGHLMHHDENDHILARLFASDEASASSTDQGWRTTILQPDLPKETFQGREGGPVFRRDSHDQKTIERRQSLSPSATDWRQVFPRQGEHVEEGQCAEMQSEVRDREALSAQGEGGPGATGSDSSGLRKVCDGPRDGTTAPGHTNTAEICSKAREESLWVWAERGSAPIGRVLSLLAMRVADCDDLASMSLLWMSFVRDVRLLWEEGEVIPRMSPMLALDGTSMLDPGASCTGQDWGIAPRLRAYRQAHGDVWSKEGAASVRERARPGQPYPDTRTSLIWQKLQMLNCCLSEVADGGPASISEQKPVGALIGRENAEELFISVGSVPDDDYEDNEDEDEGEFFDTHEWQRSDSDSDYGDMNRIMKPAFSDYDIDGRDDGRGRFAGDGNASGSKSAALALSSPDPGDHSPEWAPSASAAISSIPTGEKASPKSRPLVQSIPMSDSAGGLGEDELRKALGESGGADPKGSEVAMSTFNCLPSRSASGQPSEVPSGAVPVERKAQAVTPRSVREDQAPLRLLVRGNLVRSPELQSGGPVTSDMIAQQDATGQPGAHRSREVLVSDMEAFRRENEGAVFADFVRWYRPDCWQQSVGATEEGEQDTGTSSTDRVDDGAKEQIRLAWPGQGQVVWREARGVAVVTPFADPIRRAPLITKKASSASPVPSLSGWLSCWAEAEEAAKKGTPADRITPLWNGVTEGEKALLYLESISPQPLLVQLLSALLGLSIFVIEEACSSAKCLPAVKEAVAEAKRKAKEAVELLADEINEITGKEAATRTRSVSDSSRASSTSTSTSTSPLRLALIAADDACLELKRAEHFLSRMVSLQRALPGQEDLLNLLVGCVDKGAEVPVTDKSQKIFFRDLLVEQASSKATVEAARRKVGRAPATSSEFPGADDSTESAIEDGSMPAPKTKEYVFRCRTPAPFYHANVGRSQLDAYPTPPSRMYAKTDGKSLRVALSICESEL